MLYVSSVSLKQAFIGHTLEGQWCQAKVASEDYKLCAGNPTDVIGFLKS